ncbi:MAG: hypothetical protein GWP08_14965 [Nitrospiraceae bacterium]|nr:hypothetical protein [Nitrospiraceae bacterium]
MTLASTPIVTLTTDFGLRDPYVATVKGTIYSINARLQVVDLSHEIPPQDILEGALFLAAALPYFPEGSIHVAVVDPGVGTERHPIALRAGGQILVCPDNGLATLFLQEHPLQEARIITNPQCMREFVSATFHGRDIFAPAAARLASGMPLAEVGEELDTIVSLHVAHARKEGGNIVGEIVHVDRFGNCITNIHHSMLRDVVPSRIQAGGEAVPSGLHATYAEVQTGEPVVLFSSSGHLEIAINGGSACTRLGLGKGDTVSIEFPLPS